MTTMSHMVITLRRLSQIILYAASCNNYELHSFHISYLRRNPFHLEFTFILDSELLGLEDFLEKLPKSMIDALIKVSSLLDFKSLDMATIVIRHLFSV